MKRIIAITALVLLLGAFSTASAQEAKTAKDTLGIKMFTQLDKGDILPFKYAYQKAKIGKDTIITCSVTKDVELEVDENNKEEHYVIFNVITTNFMKSGEEANDFKNIRTTCLVDDGYPVQIRMWYDGRGEYVSYDDTLKARAEKNLMLLADTLQKYNEDLTREELAKGLETLASPNVAVSVAVSGVDFGDMFHFYDFKYVANEVYVDEDSLFCDIDNKMYAYKTYFQWDEEFSREVPDYEDFYVLRSACNIEGNLALSVMGITPDEESSKLLEDEINKKRCFHLKEITLLADKGMGIPALTDIEIVNGFYEEISDEYFSLEKILIILDFDKMMGGDDEDEDEESDEPRYDDYGFIKVK